MSNGKDTTIRLIVGLIKNTLNEIRSYKDDLNTVLSHLEVFGRNIKVKDYLATNTDLKM